MRHVSSSYSQYVRDSDCECYFRAIVCEKLWYRSLNFVWFLYSSVVCIVALLLTPTACIRFYVYFYTIIVANK